MDKSAQAVESARNGDELLRAWARRMVLHPHFSHVISLVILCHTFAMVSDQHDTSPGWRDFVSYAYLVCNLLFLGELAIRFFAAGSFHLFWVRPFNRFEMLVCGIGVVGLALNNRLLLLLPSIRLYRLMRYIPTLEDLLLSAISSTHAILNLLIFIVIIGITFIVTGRYVFGTRMDDLSRSNFGSFQVGALTIFQLLNSDSWSGVLYAAMAAMETTGSQFFAAIFVISWTCFCNLIVNNLFVAVIIENFDVAETMSSISEPGNLALFRAKLRQTFGGMWTRHTLIQNVCLPLPILASGRFRAAWNASRRLPLIKAHVLAGQSDPRPQHRRAAASDR